MLRRKSNEAWTDKHCNVTRKLVVEEGWVQKRLYDIDWSDEKKCRGCTKEEEEVTEKHRLYHCPWCQEVGNKIPAGLWKWEERANTSKEDWKWQRGIALHPERIYLYIP